jgi:hypothetical protein
MKKYIPYLTCFALLIFCLDLSGQQGKNYRKMFEVNGCRLVSELSADGASYISVKPVTNREYITYLCWLCNVYKDYPEVFMRAFPGIESANSGNNTGESFNVEKDLPKLIKSIEIDREYIFNTAYIDYPVVGISWNQAMNFMSWMSDRYNEMALIRSKELHYDPNQADENNFNTEAYIYLQYEGVVRKFPIDRKTGMEKRSDWSSRLFYPSFRLPSTEELKITENSLKSDFTAYRPERFLDYWKELYTDIRRDTLILRIGSYFESETKIPGSEKAKLTGFPSKPEEFTLDYGLNKKLTGILDIYKENGQNVIDEKTSESFFTDQKNNLGLMPFIIVGEDKNSNPVFVKRTVYKRDTSSGKFTIFRFAMNAVK